MGDLHRIEQETLSLLLNKEAELDKEAFRTGDVFASNIIDPPLGGLLQLLA